MAQRYNSPVAHERMDLLLCPECGRSAQTHSSDPRFWIPRKCDLTDAGVRDRIAQYESDLRAGV